MNRVIFNGREYASPDEMPPDVRRLYDDVLASVAGSDKVGGPGHSEIKIRTRLVVNGKEYASVAEMPLSIRGAYEKLIHHAAPGQLGANPAEASRSPQPIETSSSSALDVQLRLSASTRMVLALLVVSALAAFFLWR
jgi:hypothetical protein